ncbi:hypothetical protein CEXT_197281 [Caerostris extrusa]|uniref:Uncharacterized protein n=1 Tax=Caerostris extrusa TaxID=172846 RepID=A0AAV4UXF1_CAEEX|nr:hypothetical protein CEXT_197281 [Caerostris extrusa]
MKFDRHLEHKKLEVENDEIPVSDTGGGVIFQTHLEHKKLQVENDKFPVSDIGGDCDISNLVITLSHKKKNENKIKGNIWDRKEWMSEFHGRQLRRPVKEMACEIPHSCTHLRLSARE